MYMYIISYIVRHSEVRYTHLSLKHVHVNVSPAALNRRDLVAMALLLGCDYCPEGIGIRMRVQLHSIQYMYTMYMQLLDLELGFILIHS